MAYIKYVFERNKNLYEKAWDINPRLTWWVSFVTDWFWFTDITDISSNKRTCYKGFNNELIILSFIFIIISFLADIFFVKYSIYFEWIKYFILILMIFLPSIKLMFKMIWKFLLIYIVLFNFIISPSYDFVMGKDISNFVKMFVLGLSLFILLNLPGIYLNNEYLNKIKENESFELKKVKINKVSIYYFYCFLFNKKRLKQLEKKGLN